jgi:predicted O-linked N-acetylglucosamine transferase (SPINDLY family)
VLLDAWSVERRVGQLQYLDLRGNGDLTGLLPKEALETTDGQAILATYRRFRRAQEEQTLRPLNEVKLLVVGKEAVRKTSLLRYLTEGKPRGPDEKKTHGIVHVLAPELAQAHSNLGDALEDLEQLDAALAAYQKAASLNPGFVEAHINCANIRRLGRTALALRPDLADAHGNLGAPYENLGELQEAIDSYRAAIALNPKLLAIRTWINHKRRQICDWDGIEAEEAEILNLLAEDGSEAVHPFAVLSMGANALLQMRAAHAFAENFKAPAFEHRREDFAGARKLKIGYLSSDFCRHATALLMAELFERHDKSCFEIVAYSHGPDDRSELLRRLRGPSTTSSISAR